MVPSGPVIPSDAKNFSERPFAEIPLSPVEGLRVPVLLYQSVVASLSCSAEGGIFPAKGFSAHE